MGHKYRRRHSRRHSRSYSRGNNILGASVSAVKTTSRKYMPKVKTGLEGVGSKVIKTSKQSVPFLQRMTRKLFSRFSK
jgi:hypothetical protein